MKLNDPHKSGLRCPYTKKVCHGSSCPLYVTVSGTDAQGDAVNQGACAPAAQLLFTVELTRQLDGLQKVQETHRNEHVKGLQALALVVSTAVEQGITVRQGAEKLTHEG